MLGAEKTAAGNQANRTRGEVILKMLGKIVAAIVIFLVIKACFSLSSHMAIDSTLSSGQTNAGPESVQRQAATPDYSPVEPLPTERRGVNPSGVDTVATGRPQANQRELLKKFLNEFVVNNKSFQYPVRVDEKTLLIGRSVRDDGQTMFVVEDYKINTTATPTFGQILDATEEVERQVADIFCGSLEERDRLFSGYSSVGIIQRVRDANGNHLFSVTIDKSQCA